ncbi:hypothetical protein OROGR_011208 [Orobanche gracilis]
MDLDPTPSAPKKVRFAPKPPPRRKPKPVPAKIEPAVDDDEEAAQRHILSRIEQLSMRKLKAEEKSSGQDASRALRTYGKQKEKIDDKSNAAKSKETLNDVQKLVTYNALTVKKKKNKEFKEPWDYNNSYYPTTLPLRLPYSGDPELLDKAEFEDAREYDENSVDSAFDLGLRGESDDDTPRMLSFQFPSNLPFDSSRASRASKGKEIATSSVSRDSGHHPSRNGCSLEDLPEGYMGKMLVYKSGAVKLKLGDLVYDVSPGSDCSFAQSVMAIDTANRQCCEMGEVNKRAVVTPDIDYLIDNVIDLG